MMKIATGLCRMALVALPAFLLAAGPAAAQHTFDGNILIINENGGPNYKLANATTCSTMFAQIQASPNNDAFASLPPGFWSGAPKWPSQNWRPSINSIASGNNDFVSTIQYVNADSCDQCGYGRDFVQTCYRGALDPDPLATNWTAGGWLCQGDSAQCLPPGPLPPVVVHSGLQTTSQTWTAANTHLLRGKVNFAAGTKLTIEPGTIVLGEFATGPSFLAIEVGALIDAQGTAAQPIIFTSDQVFGTPGDWAGVVLNGRGTANCADCRGDNGPPAMCNSEGDPTLVFCATDDCDSSGVISYARVQYSGFILGANNELNCWTFNGVGSRTSLSYLQAHRGSDDLFEWFGGAANCKYLVGTGGADDGLDWQAGFRGTVQFAVIQMAPDQGDRGVEADNWELDYDAVCRSNPLIANVTLIGPPGAGTADSGFKLRHGTDAQIFNSIVYDFPDANYEIQHDESCARGINPYPPTHNCGSGVDAPVIAAGGSSDAVSVRTIPNPVVTSAEFSIQLAHDGPTRLDVFDVTGRLVANVFDENMSPGSHSISWTPGADVTPGAYFYRLQNGSTPATGKFVVVR